MRRALRRLLPQVRAPAPAAPVGPPGVQQDHRGLQRLGRGEEAQEAQDHRQGEPAGGCRVRAGAQAQARTLRRPVAQGGGWQGQEGVGQGDCRRLGHRGEPGYAGAQGPRQHHRRHLARALRRARRQVRSGLRVAGGQARGERRRRGSFRLCAHLQPPRPAGGAAPGLVHQVPPAPRAAPLARLDDTAGADHGSLYRGGGCRVCPSLARSAHGWQGQG